MDAYAPDEVGVSVDTIGAVYSANSDMSGALSSVRAFVAVSTCTSGYVELLTKSLLSQTFPSDALGVVVKDRSTNEVRTRLGWDRTGLRRPHVVHKSDLARQTTPCSGMRPRQAKHFGVQEFVKTAHLRAAAADCGSGPNSAAVPADVAKTR